MLMVEILCDYMKKSSFDEDGFLKEKDPYHIIAHVKTNRSISEIRKEIAARGCCDELAVCKEVMDIFHSGDYIEGSFEVAKILSKAGHPIIPEEDMFMLKTYVRSGKQKGRLDRNEPKFCTVIKEEKESIHFGCFLFLGAPGGARF